MVKLFVIEPRPMFARYVSDMTVILFFIDFATNTICIAQLNQSEVELTFSDFTTPHLHLKEKYF